MRRLHFILTFILIAIFAFVCGCNSEETEVKTERVLKIYNAQDYIDDGLDDDMNVVGPHILEDWANDYYDRTGEKVSYVYETFETNENMYNILKTGKETYDIICTSDYMIQKMIKNDMLIKFDMNEDGTYAYIDNYNEYGSPYLKELFDDYGFTEYTIPYMWGTMGFVYDPLYVDEDDIKSWTVLWDENYHNLSTVKNSVRDTYVVGVMYVYKNVLDELRTTLENNLSTEGLTEAQIKKYKSEYNRQVQEIMNLCDDQTIALVQDALLDLRQNIYGFEVDNGKTDVVTGKIHINFAWSGDAVYAIQAAKEDADVELNYVVPKEGSNIWFDSWAMTVDADKELAQDFINYISSPEAAIRNMNKTGYTSSIAGDEIFSMLLDDYEAEEGEERDVTYFFKGTVSEELLTDGRAIITIDEGLAAFDAQYPDEDTIMRCGIMQDFGERNDAVLNMWENVKSGASTTLLWLPIILMILGAVSFYIYKQVSLAKRKKRHNSLKNKTL